MPNVCQVATTEVDLLQQQVYSKNGILYVPELCREVGIDDLQNLTEEKRLQAEQQYPKGLIDDDAWVPEVVPDNGEVEELFRHYCATKIQAVWRMHRVRQQYQRVKSAQRVIARAFRHWITFDRRIVIRINQAAKKIQRAWRSYVQKQTFHYVRDLVRFRECGDAAFLLKVLAPAEAALADEAAGVHVRFRLGGVKFPPLIFYKIFTHRNVADMGAFAPRDYAAEAKIRHGQRKNEVGVQEKASSTCKSPPQTEEEATAQWYQRVENNGWRLLNERSIGHIFSDQHPPPKPKRQVARFHPVRAQRREARQLRAKQRQQEWMTKMYSGLKEGGSGNGSEEQERCDSPRGEERGSNHQVPLAHQDVDDDFMDEESELLAWTSALDFEAYMSDWHCIATSLNTEANRSSLDYDFWLSIRDVAERTMQEQDDMNTAADQKQRSDQREVDPLPT